MKYAQYMLSIFDFINANLKCKQNHDIQIQR